MVNFFKSLFVALAGTALGLLATWFSIEQGQGFGAVQAGPWIGWPRAGTQEADPYARAAMSRTGEVPLGLAEGLSFLARADSAGEPLQSGCAYTIRPPMPVARYWSLSVSSPEGQPLNSNFGRSGLTSSEIYRTGAGTFSISVSSRVQPGNWLPVPERQPFVLMLRLYDTPISAAASALRASDMPGIDKGACE
ncbi:MAG: DUF1214 domain-containing protein [Beijerinckiaceae bacterium]